MSSSFSATLFNLADRWDFFGNPSDFRSQGQNSIPFCSGPTTPCTFTTPAGLIQMSTQQSAAMWSACSAKAPDPVSLGAYGCYVRGNSLLVPPAYGAFGNLGRNVFRDTGFRNLDLSVSKNWKFKERFGAQFRAETFNVLNHPNFANPWGGTAGIGVGANSDPSAGPFGCGCATPDVAAVNPVLGSGSARAIQLGLKLSF